jgi:hypothetical protein
MTKDVRKNLDDSVDLCLHSVHNLLGHLLKMKATLRSDRELYLSRGPLEDAQGCVIYLDEFMKAMEKTIASTVPKRQVPTGLKPTATALRKFDPKYFSYTAEGDYRKPTTFDGVCYRLATWVFDGGDINDVKKAFGDIVYRKVHKNIKDRNHDT